MLERTGDRSRRPRNLVLAGVVIAILALGWFAGRNLSRPQLSASSVETATPLPKEAGPGQSDPDRPIALATVMNPTLLLYVPGAKADLVALGFRPSTASSALSLRPQVYVSTRETRLSVRVKIGEGDTPVSFAIDSDARRGVAAAGDFTDAAERPASSVDVVMMPQSYARSPVSGYVTRIQRHRVGGRLFEWRLEIQPVAHKTLRVTVGHLSEAAVRAGQKVDRGEVVGRPARAPRTSIDGYLPPGLPHLEMEVRRAAG